MLNTVRYRNAGDLGIGAAGRLKIGGLSSVRHRAVTGAAIASRIFVNVKVVIRFARVSGGRPTERYFNRRRWMRCGITGRQIGGQCKIVAWLSRVITLRADVDLDDGRRISHKHRTGRITNGRRALRDGSARWGRRETEHGQKAAGRAKHERGKSARIDRARLRNGISLHDVVKIEKPVGSAVFSGVRKIPIRVWGFCPLTRRGGEPGW